LLSMRSVLLLILQAVLAFGAAPGTVGLVRLLKARLQGRRGAPLWQPYFDLAKLFRKEVVVSVRASWIFRATPYIVFAPTLVAALMVPLVLASLPMARAGALVVVVFLFILANFFLALAGLDPASAFGGMGASREMTIAALAEPTFALAVFGLGVGAGSTN